MSRFSNGTVVRHRRCIRRKKGTDGRSRLIASSSRNAPSSASPSALGTGAGEAQAGPKGASRKDGFSTGNAPIDAEPGAAQLQGCDSGRHTTVTSVPCTGGRAGARPPPPAAATTAATRGRWTSCGKCRRAARSPGIERCAVLAGRLHRELEHGERLLEERMATEAGEPTATAALAGERGLREEDHPAALGNAARKARGAHQLLEEILDGRGNRRQALLSLGRGRIAPRGGRFLFGACGRRWRRAEQLLQQRGEEHR